MSRGLPLARKKPIQTKAKEQRRNRPSEKRANLDKLREKFRFGHTWRKKKKGSGGEAPPP